MSELFSEQPAAPVAQAAPVAEVQTTQLVQPAQAAPAAVPESWLNSLPEQYREVGSISRHENLGALLGSYVDGQSMFGGKSPIPDFENATAEQMSAFRGKLGVPNEVAGYNIATPEGFNSDESFEAFTNLAHKGHLSNDVTNEMFQMHTQGMERAIDGFKASQEQEVSQVMDEFKATANYDEVVLNANNMLDQIDPSGQILNEENFNQLGVAKPIIMKLLSQMKSLTGNDTTVKVGGMENLGQSFGEQHSSIMADHAAGRISEETANARIAQAASMVQR